MGIVIAPSLDINATPERSGPLWPIFPLTARGAMFLGRRRAVSGLFPQNKKPRANGYDGFNQAPMRRVERRIGQVSQP